VRPFSFQKHIVVYVLCFVLCVFFSGCSFVKKMQHLPQLLTLKRYSQEQSDLSEEVKKQNQQFDALLASISGGGFKEYKTAVRVRREFGSPVFSRVTERDARPVEEWLYRYATKYKDTDKVYLYFDFQGNLLDWVHEGADASR